jgi:hypothetical protein
MGVMQALAACVVCRRPFLFNPDRVPSVRIEGERQPVCAECIERANVQRKARGLGPIPVLPGAYDAVDETEWVP